MSLSYFAGDNLDRYYAYVKLELFLCVYSFACISI